MWQGVKTPVHITYRFTALLFTQFCGKPMMKEFKVNKRFCWTFYSLSVKCCCHVRQTTLRSVKWISLFLVLITRNSAIVDKPRDALVLCAMAWLTPKRPSPYVLPRWILWYGDGCRDNNIQEALLMLKYARDAFTGQSRSPNIVPFHMLGIVSYCAIVILSLRGAVFTIFDFKKCHDLEIGDRGYSRLLKVAPFKRLCMVS